MSTLPPDSAKPAAPVAGTDHDALPPGTRFGEFEILRVLGVGGFGIVYLAHDHSLEREVALKEYMPASLAARGLGPQITVRSSSFAETYAIGLRSFVNEARLLARFDHPSLVKVYRFWEDNATAYMVMPFLQGVTLRDTRRRMAHPPDEAWVRSVITPILSALELLHREGVYHRDIAPDNILLPPDGPPVLLDFGAARRVISDRTQSLTAILKPSYAPIEQYAEMTQLRQGPWTDLYALGAVIHYLLFGAPPAPATARAVQDDADVIENRIVPGVSPRFLEAVSWMLAIRPNQRPQSGEELRAVLDGTAVIPPRGRPGITIPPNLPAAAPTAPFQATRRVESGVEGTQVQTAHMPTFLPTAHVPAPGQPRPTTFSPTALMPTARSQASQFDTPLPSTVAPARAASTMPGELPQTRPTTVPPPLPAASGPYSQPLPAAAPAPAPMPTQAARSRPAPLAAMPDAMLPVTPAAPGQGQGASKAWLAVAGAGVVVVIAAAAAWQFAGKRGDGVDASAAAASAVSSTAAASVPALPPVAATTSPTATTAAAAATTAATLPTTPATAMTATVPNPSTLPAVDSGASPTRPAIASTGTDRPVLPDDAKPVPSRTPRPATTARVETPPDSGRLPVSERNAVAGERGGPVEASASGTRPRPLGRPVPRVGEGDPATAGPSTSPRPFENANGPRGNPYGTPPVVNYGSGTTAAGNPVERSRPLGMPAQREPALAGRPVPQPAEIGAPTSAREACGRRVFIALAVCMDDRCEEPRFRNTAECIGILERKHTREGR